MDRTSDAIIKSSKITRDFGLTLKRIRMNLGLSQEKLASRVYLTRQQISNIELGKSQASLESANNLAYALKELYPAAIDELFGSTGTKTYCKENANMTDAKIISQQNFSDTDYKIKGRSNLNGNLLRVSSTYSVRELPCNDARYRLFLRSKGTPEEYLFVDDSGYSISSYTLVCSDRQSGAPLLTTSFMLSDPELFLTFPSFISMLGTNENCPDFYKIPPHLFYEIRDNSGLARYEEPFFIECDNWHDLSCAELHNSLKEILSPIKDSMVLLCGKPQIMETAEDAVNDSVFLLCYGVIEECAGKCCAEIYELDTSERGKLCGLIADYFREKDFSTNSLNGTVFRFNEDIFENYIFRFIRLCEQGIEPFTICTYE